MDRALTWFINIWAGLVVALNILSIVGFVIGAESFWQGWSRISDAYSPWNIWTHGLNMVLLSPAFAAYLWRRKLRGHSYEV